MLYYCGLTHKLKIVSALTSSNVNVKPKAPVVSRSPVKPLGTFFTQISSLASLIDNLPTSFIDANVGVIFEVQSLVSPAVKK